MIHTGGTDQQNSSHGSVNDSTWRGGRGPLWLWLTWEDSEALAEEQVKTFIRIACCLSFNLFYMTWCDLWCDLWWIFEET